MFQIDYKGGTPIYDQIVNSIVQLKMLGAYKGGDPLPSVRAMASKLSINPNTVQRAYAILEEKGIIYSASGKGSFISEDKAGEESIKLFAKQKIIEEIDIAKLRGLTKEEIYALVDMAFKEEN